jgi:hypothetical protein
MIRYIKYRYHQFWYPLCHVMKIQWLKKIRYESLVYNTLIGDLLKRDQLSWDSLAWNTCRNDMAHYIFLRDDFNIIDFFFFLIDNIIDFCIAVNAFFLFAVFFKKSNQFVLVSIIFILETLYVMHIMFTCFKLKNTIIIWWNV